MVDGLAHGWLEALGAAGFAMLFVAAAMPRRLHLIAVDLVGIATVSAYWALMGEWAGAALNSLFILNDATALAGRLDARPRMKAFFIALLIVLASLLAVRAPVDLLPVAGAALVFTAIQQTDMARLRWIMLASGSSWGAYGFATDAAAQIVFTIVVSGLHGLRLMELYRDRAEKSRRAGE